MLMPDNEERHDCLPRMLAQRVYRDVITPLFRPLAAGVNLEFLVAQGTGSTPAGRPSQTAGKLQGCGLQIDSVNSLGIFTGV
jgi:hypothetical protein